MLAVIAALTAFVAVAAGAIGVLSASNATVDQRLSRLAARRNIRPQASDDAEMLAGRRSGPLSRLVPSRWVGSLGHMLEGAGVTMPAGQFLWTWVLAIMIAGAAGPVFMLLVSGKVGPVGAILMITGVMLAVLFPFLYLRRAARARRSAVWKSLPDACDLITLSVEAGLGLDAALRLVAQKLNGPVSEEFEQAMREIRVGRTRREALEAMAERVTLPELSTFVQSLVQTDALGTSLGNVLRAQAATMRARRRQKAQEMVRKAPVKMVFPLVLCTIPAFMIIVIGPFIVRFIDYVGN
jgi:tight adherence protein C